MTWTYLTDPENIIEAHIPELVEDIYLSPIRSDGFDKVVLFFNDLVKGQKISEGNYSKIAKKSLFVPLFGKNLS